MAYVNGFPVRSRLGTEAATRRLVESVRRIYGQSVSKNGSCPYRPRPPVPIVTETKPVAPASTT